MLNFRRYAAYQNNLYDLGSYSQVIWNVSRGAGFTTSLGPTEYLTNHFSPLMGLIAPLYWAWPDARVLMVVQTLLMVASIVPGYLILRKRYPRLAPVLGLAFVLSPLAQQTVLEEFHGILLVPPLLAWAFYALYTRRTWWMLFFLALTLFVREDMGLYIAAFGAYLLLFRPKQRLLGLGLIGFGGAAVLVVINVIMPSFGHAYHHFVAFSALGNSTSEITTNALRDPIRVISSIFTPSKIRALVRFIAPLAGLPILAITYLPLWLPGLFVYLLSNASGAGLLNNWRVASLLPLIWCATAAWLAERSVRWAQIGLIGLMTATLIGFFSLSPFPGGKQFNPGLYEINAHTLLGDQIVASVPREASVATQSGLGAVLAPRAWIRLFPWFDRSKLPDVIVLDEKAVNLFPLNAEEFRAALLDLQADPRVDVTWEQDGYFVFKPTHTLTDTARPLTVMGDSVLRLDNFDLAQAQAGEKFEPVVQLAAGDMLRVSLYWTAMQPMPQHLAISVRMAAPDGSLIAQDDSWPARGALPTPLWEAGRSIRDVHYLSLPEGSLPDQLTLNVIVYNAETSDRLTPTDGYVLATWPNSPAK